LKMKHADVPTHPNPAWPALSTAYAHDASACKTTHHKAWQGEPLHGSLR
jgi:hypothetical protein